MSSPRSPPPAPPLDDDNLLAEILLRLPPQPSSLPRASLVCKRWRSVASDPAFSRRFRRHHRRNPPLLGFFRVDAKLPFVPTLKTPNRVSPERFSWQRGDDGGGERFKPLGCRHDLALILNTSRNQVLVWDPVTGDQHGIAIPPGLEMEETPISGAVFRAAGDAHHFRVALVGNREGQITQAAAHVYSSETEQRWALMILEFAEENNVALMWTHDVLFMIQLKSLKFEKLLGIKTIGHFHSFESVYTAGDSMLYIMGIYGGLDGADLQRNT